MTTATASPAANRAGWNRMPVTVTLGATDALSGVAQTEFRLAGAPVWVPYPPFVVSENGAKTFEYRSIDQAGNVESARRLTVRIDTTKTVTRALAGANVRRGSRATLRLRVGDRVAPKATVVVKIYRGKALKKTLKLGLRKTNAEVHYRFTCNLARGRYTWKVYATDLAGNRQSKIGSASLTVR